MSFVHLHVHSEYSMLDGLSHVPDLVVARPRAGHAGPGADRPRGDVRRDRLLSGGARPPACNPIIGMEAYLSPRRMHDRDPQLDTPCLPPAAAGRERRRLPQPDPDRHARRSWRGSTIGRGSIASTWKRTAGPDLHHRLPLRPDAAGVAGGTPAGSPPACRLVPARSSAATVSSSSSRITTSASCPRSIVG